MPALAHLGLDPNGSLISHNLKADRALAAYTIQIMGRITLPIPDNLKLRLRGEARRRGISISEAVRKAIEKHLDDAPDLPTELPFTALRRGGRRDTARKADKILSEEWTEAGRS